MGSLIQGRKQEGNRVCDPGFPTQSPPPLGPGLSVACFSSHLRKPTGASPGPQEWVASLCSSCSGRHPQVLILLKPPRDNLVRSFWAAGHPLTMT